MPVSESRIEVYEKGHRVPFAYRPPLSTASFFQNDDAVLERYVKQEPADYGERQMATALLFLFEDEATRSHRAHQKNKGSTAKLLGRYVADTAFCSSQRFFPRSSWRRGPFDRIFGTGTPRWSTNVWRTDRTCAAILA